MIERIRIIWWWIQDYFYNKPFGSLRSGGWYKFRKIHIKLFCEGCGVKGTFLKSLQLHHCEPFNQNPARELDPTNVITLCWYCHFVLAHLRNFKSWNIRIKEDAAWLLDKIINRP